MVTEAVRTQIAEYLASRDLRPVRDLLLTELPADIAELIDGLPAEDQAIVFRILPRELATDVFELVDVERQKALLATLGDQRIAIILNEMSPDDRTALLGEMPAPAVKQLLQLLSKEERKVAAKLLGYPERSVGRLMTPDYLTLDEEWTVRQALDHIRQNGKDSDTLNVLYVLDKRGRLVDDVRIRELLLSDPGKRISELVHGTFISLEAAADQEEAVRIFQKYDRNVLPVIDNMGVMLGIVTSDDVLDVAQAEATEDIQKLGAVEALKEPYISIPILSLIRKRAVWLVVLFFGEMFTAGAMGLYQHELEQAVVLALFIPLIISSGGNSGSQAATLVIRALAVGEVTLSDWFRVFSREILAGLALGGILALIGYLRITVWHLMGAAYGPHWASLGLAVSASIVGVVLWGTIIGSMLPFVLKRLGLDPATSSAPFVATLVDVTGLVIYFSLASLILSDLS